MPKPSLHPKKVMVTVWWSAAGLIHYNFLKPGETITAEKYCSELDVVHQKLSKKQPALVNRKGPILLHDNARPHVSKITLQKLNKLGYEVLPHPPYSPHLSPTDYHYFNRDKTFTNQTTVEDEFKKFGDFTDSKFFKCGIEKLVILWQKCIESNGAYFD